MPRRRPSEDRHGLGAGRAPRRCVAVAGVLLGLSLCAQPIAPVFEQDFEDQTPGQPPVGWSVTWGDLGDDLIRVTNIESAHGDHALMFDRESGSNMQPIKLWRSIPNISADWAVLSLCFMIHGNAAVSRFLFEIGGQHPDHAVRVDVALRGWGPDVYLYPTVLPTWTENWERKTVMAAFEPRCWHRLTLWLPTAEGQQNAAYGMIERGESGGTWARVGSVRAVPSRPPKAGYNSMSFVLAQGARGYRLYVDHIIFRQSSAVPPQAAVP